MRWSPGDPVAWRVRVRIAADRPDGELSAVVAARVISDDPDEIVVFIAAGGVTKLRTGRHGGPRDRVVLSLGEGFRDGTWKANRLLIRRPQDGHAVSLFWDGLTWEFRFWYVDLQGPLGRVRSGLEAVDHGIDVVVDPDMAAWRWKDAEELDWYVEHGRYSAAEAADLRVEGERAVLRLRRDRERFERWQAWRPDPAWSAPPLPDGWDEP